MDGRSRQNPAYRLAKGKGSARGPFPFERWFAGGGRIPFRGAPRPPGSGADSLPGTQPPPALRRLLDLVARCASLDPVVAKT